MGFIFEFLVFQTNYKVVEVPRIDRVYEDTSVYGTCPSVFEQFNQNNSGSGRIITMMPFCLIINTLVFGIWVQLM